MMKAILSWCISSASLTCIISTAVAQFMTWKNGLIRSRKHVYYCVFISFNHLEQLNGKLQNFLFEQTSCMKWCKGNGMKIYAKPEITSRTCLVIHLVFGIVVLRENGKHIKRPCQASYVNCIKLDIIQFMLNLFIYFYVH